MITPRKSLGQNYLQNKAIMQKIADSLELNTSDKIMEIGSGPCNLTSYLLPLVEKIYAVEIDNRYEAISKQINEEFRNLEIVFGDFLTINLDIFKNIKKITGNLPYNISTPILERVTYELNPDLCVFMFAIDTAKRFLAQPSTKDYSSATIFVTSFYEIKKVTLVKRANFFPIPKVDSMVIKFVSKKGINKEYLKEFNLFVQKLFFYRRKTILNSLSQNLNSKNDSKAILDKANIDNNCRIETLNIVELNNLYGSYREYK